MSRNPTKSNVHRLETIDKTELAIRFHKLYEQYAPMFGYKTREDTKQFKIHTPNGQLMISVCQQINKEISEIVKEIIGEQEDETSKNNPYANRRNPKLRNRLRRTQFESARGRGIEI